MNNEHSALTLTGNLALFNLLGGLCIFMSEYDRLRIKNNGISVLMSFLCVHIAEKE